jgi:hypothetical protein
VCTMARGALKETSDMREKDNTARRLPAFERRAPLVVPLRLVTRAPSAWERCKTRVRTIIHHERFGESVFLVLTLLLVCTLLASVHHAIGASAMRWPVSRPYPG